MTNRLNEQWLLDQLNSLGEFAKRSIPPAVQEEIRKVANAVCNRATCPAEECHGPNPDFTVEAFLAHATQLREALERSGYTDVGAGVSSCTFDEITRYLGALRSCLLTEDVPLSALLRKTAESRGACVAWIAPPGQWDESLSLMLTCHGRWDELAAIRSAFAEPSAPAIVLHGEAGMGKTRLVIESVERPSRAASNRGELGILIAVTPSSLSPPFTECPEFIECSAQATSAKSDSPDEPTPRFRSTEHVGRATDLLLALLRDALGTMPKQRCGPPGELTRVVIALDGVAPAASGDAEPVRNLAKLIIAFRHELSAALLPALRGALEAKHNVTVAEGAIRFVISGVGAADVVHFRPPPSFRSCYRLFPVQPVDMAGHVVRLPPQTLHFRLLKAMWNNSIGAAAATNPRFALMCDDLLRVGSDRVVDLLSVNPTYCTQELVQHMLFAAATLYRRAGPCQSIEHETVAEGLQCEALHYAIHPAYANAADAPPCVRVYGMLIDTAVAAARQGDPPMHQEDDERRGVRRLDGSAALLEVRRGTFRFQMSASQVMLLRLGYGFGDPGNSWRSFEEATANWLGLVAMGLGGKMQLVVDFLTKPYKETEPVQSPPECVALTSVRIVRLTRWLCGQKECMDPDDWRACIVAGADVTILINAIGAPFADVVVVLRDGILLVRCRHGKVPVTLPALRAEVARMAASSTSERGRSESPNETSLQMLCADGAKCQCLRAVVACEFDDEVKSTPDVGCIAVAIDRKTGYHEPTKDRLPYSFPIRDLRDVGEANTLSTHVQEPIAAGRTARKRQADRPDDTHLPPKRRRAGGSGKGSLTRPRPRRSA